ncbi:MAG: NUDIX domain-containing protein [Candidatus Omnitrophica bacterium]|nr:NUDIX domain-containing protein [Candidatus Omnitrophota bacterium]
MSVFEPSHAVAVTGYVYEGGRFLLLKRTTPPLIWAPPGGRLLPGEDPLEGVLREVGEETGLRGRVLGLVDYWFGEIADRGALLSLDFVLSPESDSVRLSEEHEAFVWATLEDMKKDPPIWATPRGATIWDTSKRPRGRRWKPSKTFQRSAIIDFRCQEL